MTTPPSTRQAIPAEESPRTADHLLSNPTGGRIGVRPRGPKRADPGRLAPSLRREDSRVMATWNSALGRCELIVGIAPQGLQVKQSTWHTAGSVVEEVFVLHARVEFERWHAASPTRFDHPVAHDEIRRFAHASLPE